MSHTLESCVFHVFEGLFTRLFVKSLIDIPYLLALLSPVVNMSGFNFLSLHLSFHLLWSPCTPLPLTSASDLLLPLPPSHTLLHLQLP